jgi:hypothetical protein
MTEDNRSAMEKLEEKLKELWRKSGQASIIAARHTEFVVEPKVFIGNKIHPDVLKIITLAYLSNTAAQDSGVGNVDATPDKLVINDDEGKPMVVVRDKRIIRQYIAQRA